jgi:hypothetical protein
MSRFALSAAHPYRTPVLRVATPVREPSGVLDKAQGLASWLLLGWAALRVGVCTFEGLDLVGFVALVIVVMAVA